jgi:hypothetical protein
MSASAVVELAFVTTTSTIKISSRNKRSLRANIFVINYSWGIITESLIDCQVFSKLINRDA